MHLSRPPLHPFDGILSLASQGYLPGTAGRIGILMRVLRVSMAMTVFVIMSMTMTMLNALATRPCLAQAALQILIDGSPHRARSASRRLDATLLKESQRPPSHASADHHLRPLALDERRDFPWPMRAQMGILDHLDALDRLPLEVHQGEVRTSSEMMANLAVQPASILC